MIMHTRTCMSHKTFSRLSRRVSRRKSNVSPRRLVFLGSRNNNNLRNFVLWPTFVLGGLQKSQKDLRIESIFNISITHNIQQCCYISHIFFFFYYLGISKGLKRLKFQNYNYFFIKNLMFIRNAVISYIYQ